MDASVIQTFFQSSTRDENDATNKVRENKILSVLCDPPKDYLEHPEFGKSWNIVYESWKKVLQQIAEQTSVPFYTSTQIKLKGGRRFNYDADILYYNEKNLVGTRKIEFKYGCSSIAALPQILSLQAKISLFTETYDKFWYEKYLDKYLACDTGITQSKPSLEVYLKNVTKTTYTVTPFFAQLKEREHVFEEEKKEIVNASISDYLVQFGGTIDLPAFSQKIQDTQKEKIYLLWSNGKFHFDRISEKEMTEMVYHSIKNGNVLEIKSGAATYGLLLRWRNHKGILNPAWQISLKRSAEPSPTP